MIGLIGRMIEQMFDNVYKSVCVAVSNKSFIKTLFGYSRK